MLACLCGGILEAGFLMFVMGMLGSSFVFTHVYNARMKKKRHKHQRRCKCKGCKDVEKPTK